MTLYEFTAGGGKFTDEQAETCFPDELEYRLTGAQAFNLLMILLRKLQHCEVSEIISFTCVGELKPKEVTALLGLPRRVLLACPWCAHRGSIETPIQPLETVVSCSWCKRQILVAGSPEKPYAFNPMMPHAGEIKPVCKFGCHFTEPYGFVPMAGCPTHD